MFWIRQTRVIRGARDIPIYRIYCGRANSCTKSYRNIWKISDVLDLCDKSDISDISDMWEIDMDTSKLPFRSPDHSKLGSKAGHSKLGTDRAAFLFKFSKTTRDPP